MSNHDEHATGATPEWKGDGLPGGRIALIGAMCVALTIASTLVSLLIYRMAERQEERQKQVAPPYTSADEVIAAQTEKLKSYGFADPEKKIVTIPIDRAMEIVGKELAEAQKADNPAEKKSDGAR